MGVLKYAWLLLLLAVVLYGCELLQLNATVAENKPPVLFLPQTVLTVNEGETVKIHYSARDPENSSVQVSFSGWMNSSERTTDFEDAGNHLVYIAAADGRNNISKEVTVIVNNVNRPPVIQPLQDIAASVNKTVKVAANVSDPDNDIVAVNYLLPLSSNGEWTPQASDIGTHFATVTATDGRLNTSATFKITVKPANRLPIIWVQNDTIVIKEGEKALINYTVWDPDGDKINVTFKGYMADGSIQAGYDDAGTHSTFIIASDGEAVARKEVITIVLDVNRPPVFNPPLS